MPETTPGQLTYQVLPDGRVVLGHYDVFGQFQLDTSYNPYTGGAGQVPPSPEELRRYAAEALLTETQASLLPGQQAAQQGATQQQIDIDRYFKAIAAVQQQQGLGQSQQQIDISKQLGLGRLGLDQATLDEAIRAAKESESQKRKAGALDVASAAISSYLRSQEMADARKLAALQEQRALLPSMVDPSQQFFSGLGPGDALAKVLGNFGLPFSPVPIQHTTINPADLANPAANPLGGIAGPASDLLTSLLGGGQ